MIPVAIEGCRGWFHRGVGARGVVLCSAHGFEEFCSRHSWRILAERLAQSGVPTLRFDYPGTGDSAGLDSDPARVAAWLASVRAAIDWLKHETGAGEIALVGLRLGALLAATVAAERRDIGRIALLAPVATGSAYGREMRLTASTMVPTGSEELVREPMPDAIEVAGFEITYRTLEELRGVSMMSLAHVPAPRVLTLERDGTAGEAAVAGHLARLGAQVTRRPFPGYRQMMVEPLNSRPCMKAIEEVVAWARDLEPAAGGVGQRPAAPALIADRDWIEEPLLLGPDGRLAGILCKPAAPTRPERPCLLILNSGRDYHIGWARGSVQLARTLARQGIASLRFDPQGVGDSLAQPLARRAPLYALSARADVIAAIDLLAARGYGRIGLYGACSGAYLAFQVALVDPRIEAVALRNLQRFVWRLEDVITFSALGEYGAMLARGETSLQNSWGRYASRTVRRILKTGKGALVGVLGRVAALHGDPARVQRWIGEIAARRGRVLMAFSANDTGREHLDRMLGRDGAAVLGVPGVAIRFIDGADHNFTGRRERRAFETMLVDFLLERDASATPGRQPDVHSASA